MHYRKNTYDDEARRYCGVVSPQQGREGMIWQGFEGHPPWVYCGPVLRHSAEPIQAANFRSAVAF